MESVLVVDDHEGFRAYARVFLPANGFVVVGEAADGATAIAECRRLRPDMVLLDVQLPDIDGFEVSRRIADETDRTVVILVSSREASDYGTRILDSGARGFLTKSQLTGLAMRAILR